MDTTIAAYLVPTSSGAEYALASSRPDARRAILSGLLRGAASRPVPLGKLAELAGITDRKEAGGLLFRMQREGWLSGDVEPLRLPNTPLAEAVPGFLSTLSTLGMAVLADGDGMCFGYAGLERGTAEKIAAFSAGLYPITRRFENDLGSDAFLHHNLITTQNARQEVRFSVRALHVGRHLFHLTLAGAPAPGGDAFVQLAATLSHRYLGEY
jgi:hypothetical protein